MKNIQTPYQTAIYELLDGSITIDGSAIAIYDKMSIPTSADYPHVVISDWTNVPDNDKDGFNNETTLTMMIYDQVAGAQGSRANIYDIKNQLMQTLIPDVSEPDLSVAGFNLVWGRLDNTNSLPKEKTDTHITFGEMIRFRFWIEQL